MPILKEEYINMAIPVPYLLPIAFYFPDYIDAEPEPLTYILKEFKIFFKVWLSVTFLPLYPLTNERVIVLFDTESFKPKWVYFGAHGKGQGIWKTFRECEKTAKGELKVYVARGSHGMFPHAQTYCRMFGFANDVCDANGYIWIPDRQERFKFDMHIDNPTSGSISFLARVFISLPFVIHRVNRQKLCTSLKVPKEKKRPRLVSGKFFF